MSLSSIFRNLARSAEAVAKTTMGNTVEGLKVVDSDGRSICLVAKEPVGDEASTFMLSRPEDDFGSVVAKVFPDGRSAIGLSDPRSEVPCAQINMQKDGTPSVTVKHEGRGTQMAMSFDQDGLPFFAIMDSQGRPRAAIDLEEDESPRFVLLDEEGNETWSAGRGVDG